MDLGEQVHDTKDMGGEREDEEDCVWWGKIITSNVIIITLWIFLFSYVIYLSGICNLSN